MSRVSPRQHESGITATNTGILNIRRFSKARTGIYVFSNEKLRRYKIKDVHQNVDEIICKSVYRSDLRIGYEYDRGNARAPPDGGVSCLNLSCQTLPDLLPRIHENLI